MRRLFVLAALCVASELASSGLAAEPVEAPQCLTPERIRQTEIIDDDTILFHMSDGKTWRNTLQYHCPGLRLTGGFAYEVSGAQICGNLQTIHVLRGGPICQLGAFSLPDPAKSQRND